MPRPTDRATVSRRSLGLAALGAPLLTLVTSESVTARPAKQTGAAPPTVLSAGTIHAWGGASPVVNGDTWEFVLDSQRAPENPRRSELWWNVYGTPAAYHEGELAGYACEFSADLGGASNTAADWHLVWQLHGPTNGVWKGPAMTLTVANGRLRMTGGSGHPAHDPDAGRYYQWFKDLVPFENQRVYRIRISTLLSSQSDRGWISASVDDRLLLDQWRPVSHTGLRPGTIMPGQPEVNSRSGLYRGTLPGGRPPTYRQWARHRRPLVL